MSGNSILKDGCLITERYGTDLEKLNQEDRVGLMRTSDVSFPIPNSRDLEIELRGIHFHHSN